MANNQIFQATAPASFMIAGEHAVLHGYPAIVGTLTQKLTVTLTPREDDFVVIHSDTLGELTIKRDEIKVTKPFQYVLAALENYQARLPGGVTIEITSDFSHQIGFGSSAAVTVASLTAIRSWLELPVSKKELVIEGREVVRRVAGIGSGADIAASVYGGVILYDPITTEIESLPHLPSATLCYVGYKTATAEVIRQVEERRLAEPETYSKSFADIGRIVAAIKAALQSGSQKDLAHSFLEHHKLQQEIGTSDDNIELLRHVLGGDPGVSASKISGSGLGDCVLALGEPRNKDFAMQLFPVVISSDGVVYGRKTLSPTPLPDGEGNTPKINFHLNTPAKEVGYGFAPANIALIKYWGKRDIALNLPLTSSLSISLGNKGSSTKISEHSASNTDMVLLNDEEVASNSTFHQRLVAYLDSFRPHTKFRFHVDTTNNIPTAGGLASSASGFAALVLALNDYFQWQATPEVLSQLARTGSGSACRSLWHGFVKWQRGERDDGLDSFATKLSATWPSLRIAIILNSAEAKTLSSRQAMIQTNNTSPYISLWPQCVARDLAMIEEAILKHDFVSLGSIAEANAEAMHALMLSARPAISYANAMTLASKASVLGLRRDGVPVYYTQDAGPHLKLIFEAAQTSDIIQAFPQAEIVVPF